MPIALGDLGLRQALVEAQPDDLALTLRAIVRAARPRPGDRRCWSNPTSSSARKPCRSTAPSSSGPAASMVPTLYAAVAARPRSTSSRSTRRCAANCSTVGLRPFCCDSSSEARRIGEMQLLGRPRHAHRPRPIAEVALQFALDRRRRERRECRSVVGIEAIDRLHEAEHGDLAEVVVRAASGSEPLGDVARRGRDGARRSRCGVCDPPTLRNDGTGCRRRRRRPPTFRS